MKKQNQDGEAQDSASDCGSEKLGANDYGSVEYWEERYTKTSGQRFDWLESYESLRELIIREIGEDKNKLILNVGCGNGQIQDYLYQAGYHKIYNNDISKQCIRQMLQIKQAKNHHQMVYEVMDVTCMTYADKFFDLVLDKSTLDALLCSDHPYIQTAKMLSEIERVLKDDGIYLAISYGAPENRMKHLVRQHVNLTVQTEELVRINQKGDKLVHYAYMCRKLPKVPRSKQWLQNFYAELQKQQNEYYGLNSQ